MKNIPFNTATFQQSLKTHPQFPDMIILDGIGGAKTTVVLETIRWKESVAYCGCYLKLKYVNNGNLVNLDWSKYMDQTHNNIVMGIEDAWTLHERILMLQNGFISFAGVCKDMGVLPRHLDPILRDELPVLGLAVYLRNGLLCKEGLCEHSTYDLYVKPFDIARIRQAIEEWESMGGDTWSN